jgi:hypothetical protein
MRPVLSRSRLVILGAFRVGIGTAMLARPGDLPRLLGADSLTAERMSYLGRMVGARELALGVGTLGAARRGGDPSPWLLAQALSDAVDSLAFAGAGARGHAGRPMAAALSVFAGSGAVAESLMWREARAALGSARSAQPPG